MHNPTYFCNNLHHKLPTLPPDFCRMKSIPSFVSYHLIHNIERHWDSKLNPNSFHNLGRLIQKVHRLLHNLALPIQ